MNINVVIGANYGDEGKGLMTDYFASQCRDTGIVVRFNGGAQAGHTVVTPEGYRHVFKHWGAGTFCGLPTYLSKHFIVNPMLFAQETKKLLKHAPDLPNLFIDNRCIVTTPYDMLINEIVEKSRGENRHGSVGVGINETIERNTKSFYSLDYTNLFRSENFLYKVLKGIKEDYVPQRLEKLGINNIPLEYVKLLSNDNIIYNFMEDVYFLTNMGTFCTHGILKDYDSIIFEGAQGLLLDQNHENFPHVTRSNTGLKNVVQILNEANIEDAINVTYVTRAYMTRHGNGPFPGEVAERPYPNIIDLTNVPNPYQGELRYGIFDVLNFKNTIYTDCAFLLGRICNDTINVAVTCLDQVGDDVNLKVGGFGIKESVEGFLRIVKGECKPTNLFCSYGMTRESIKIIK